MTKAKRRVSQQRHDKKEEEEEQRSPSSSPPPQSLAAAADGSSALQAEVFAASGRFQDLGLCDPLCEHMYARMGFSTPTHIQQAAIPSFLSDGDLLVNAETGTGKTLVYLAPIVHKLQANMKKITRAEGTYALVLVPTRELCLQVYEVARQLVHRFQWLVPGYVTGGENRLKEKARLRKGVTILIATPGRLLDHLKNTTSFCYENLRWIVFDEADRLLDLGFGKDIETILSFVDTHQSRKQSKRREVKCQHVLLSATLDEQVLKLASLSLKNPATVGFAESESLSRSHIKCGVLEKSLTSDQDHNKTLEYSLPPQLIQTYITVPCNLRLVTLLAVLHMWLDKSTGHKVVVFLSTCDSVDFHYALLNEFCWSFLPTDEVSDTKGFLECKIKRLHGNMSQQDRTDTFLEFNKESSALLLCTDVAARGLDIPRVTHIIQYDSPGDANEYVHRVGRTARLGKKGEALLFLQPHEKDYLRELGKHGVTLKEFPLAVLWKPLLKQSGRVEVVVDSLEMQPTLIIMQKALESFIGKQGSMKHLAADAFRSYVRAYAAHKGELKSIFQVKKLHLGHVAKSFGLSDRPSLIGKSSKKKQMKRKRAEALKQTKKKRRKLKPAAMLE